MSPVYSALDPVSAAVFTALNVPALMDQASGGVGDDIEQLTSRPCVLYVVEETPIGGLGVRPGTGRTIQIDLRVSVFSEQHGPREAQLILGTCIGLLDGTLTVSGFAVSDDGRGTYHLQTIPLADQEIAGVKVKELVGVFRLFVTEVP